MNLFLFSDQQQYSQSISSIGALSFTVSARIPLHKLSSSTGALSFTVSARMPLHKLSISGSSKESEDIALHRSGNLSFGFGICQYIAMKWGRFSLRRVRFSKRERERTLLWSLAAIDIVVQEVLVEALGSSAELSSRDLFLPRFELFVDDDTA